MDRATPSRRSLHSVRKNKPKLGFISPKKIKSIWFVDDKPSIWNQRVELELKKIHERNERKNNTKNVGTVSTWRKNREEIIVNHKNSKLNDQKTKKYGLGGEENVIGRQHQTIPYGGHGFKAKFKNIPKNVLKAVSRPTPPCTFWSPVVKNRLYDHSEKPSNIPYFGDDVIDNDRSLIEAAENDVNATPPKTDDTKKSDLSDEVFLELVNALKEYDIEAPVLQNESIKEFNKKDSPPILSPKKTKWEEEYLGKAVRDSSLPSLSVFEAIATAENQPTEKLISQYESLTSPTSGFIANIDSKEFFLKNMDSKDMQLSSMSSEKATNSYTSLLCRRCFNFDCDFHNDEPHYELEPIPLIIPKSKAPEKLPCGANCVLSISTDSNAPQVYSKLYDTQLADDLNPMKELTGTAQDIWTGPEQTMFRVLIKTFPDNFCAIAQIIITKNCRQVSQFSSKEKASPRRKSNRKTLKKKAKNQHQLFKMCSGGERENSQPYRPCYHPGEVCNAETCTCHQTNNFCEKFCYCDQECKVRWPGCTCKGNCTTKHCPCFLASRECDPDLCKACPVSAYDFDPATCKCKNVVIQKMMGKQLYIGKSEVPGTDMLGCFIGEDVESNEFIAEYVGEMINQEEGERRGKAYDEFKCSYMFKLNDHFLIDAAKFGGKIRFANHSDTPNCRVKIVLVNGDHRIGIYGARSINAGEELYFDYGEEFKGRGHDISKLNMSKLN